MSLKANILANYLGQGWRAFIGFAFVPMYIHYLGIEAYGLIGLFATMQAGLSLLDLGLRPALGREMARYTGGAIEIQHLRTLLRSVEGVALASAGLLVLTVWSLSSWFANNWVTAKSIPTSTVAQVCTVMGIMTGLAFVESLYVSCLSGLQHQVLQNAITSGVATVRSIGAVAILAWVSPTIRAFFVWQAVTSMASLVIFAASVYRHLAPSTGSVSFSLEALKGIWRFAAGMVAINLLSLLLIEADKVLLSRLLTLEAFGYYALAGTVAQSLAMLVGPIAFAYYPRFTDLIARGEAAELRRSYHIAAQLSTVLLAPAAAMLIVFGQRVLGLWTGNVALAASTAPLLALLAAGSLINCLMLVPYHLQISHGWTALVTKFNMASVAILIPALLWAVPRYGPIAGATVWLVLNSGYLFIMIHLMHRKLLPTEKWRWYAYDLILPLAAAFVTANVCMRAITPGRTKLAEFAALTLAGGLTFISAALSTSYIRANAIGRYRERQQCLKPIVARGIEE